MSTGAAATQPRRILLTVATVLALLLLVAGRLLAEPMRVSSASMTPTFVTGDRLLVGTGVIGEGRADPGEVVVFHRPGPGEAAGELLVKRVAAVAGDQVGVRDGRLVVNGVWVPEEYVVQTAVDGTYFGPVTVPPGCVFVLGDNRADSLDSRDFGAVPTDMLVGRVLFRFWPAW